MLDENGVVPSKLVQEHSQIKKVVHKIHKEQHLISIVRQLDFQKLGSQEDSSRRNMMRFELQAQRCAKTAHPSPLPQPFSLATNMFVTHVLPVTQAYLANL